MNAQTSVVPVSVECTRFVSHVPKQQKPPAPFRKVIDARGNPIRGLWERNGRFYCQMRVQGKRNAVKVPLVDSLGAPLRTVARARTALHALIEKRTNGSFSALGRTPTLGEYIESYISWLRRTQAKSPLTINKETGALAKWNARLGSVRLAQVRRVHINEFIAWRKETDKVSNRTINLDVIVLNNCLGHARDEGLISKLPTEGWRPLAHVSPRRPLWTDGQIELVCQKALEECANGQLLVDYVKFLACSGARRSEALAIEWAHVDWPRGMVLLNTTKYGRSRNVDFNPSLEALLKDMYARRTDSKWLFPSPFRDAENDLAATSLQACLETARNAAALAAFCFHDLRHYFISACVMAGIDFMTIAKWVGHRDGGVLIGRVYGHLTDAHAKRMAAKLTAL